MNGNPWPDFTDDTNMQDVKDDKATDQAASLPSSFKKQRLSSYGQEAQEAGPSLSEFESKLRDSSLYSGIALVYGDRSLGLRKVKRTLSELFFKYIDLDEHDIRHDLRRDLEVSLFTIAQFKGYLQPTAAAGSQPFVISVFCGGQRGQSPGSLDTLRGSLDIVDDIIKRFLPKSAPHLTHIPKLFFVSSLFRCKDLDTQPPSFPDDDDANYCIAYHLTKRRSDQQIWMENVTDLLRSGKKVQDVIVSLHSLLDKDSECLYTFCCLKDELVLK